MRPLLHSRIQPLTPQRVPFLHYLFQLGLHVITLAEADPVCTTHVSNIKAKSEAYNAFAKLIQDYLIIPL